MQSALPMPQVFPFKKYATKTIFITQQIFHSCLRIDCPRARIMSAPPSDTCPAVRSVAYKGAPAATQTQGPPGNNCYNRCVPPPLPDAGIHVIPVLPCGRNPPLLDLRFRGSDVFVVHITPSNPPGLPPARGNRCYPEIQRIQEPNLIV